MSLVELNSLASVTINTLLLKISASLSMNMISSASSVPTVLAKPLLFVAY